jgi:hypothetical protein
VDDDVGVVLDDEDVLGCLASVPTKVLRTPIEAIAT